MNAYKESDLLKDIKFKGDSINIKNDMVNINIITWSNERLDLFEFYSHTDQKGYARCTLYYMLKWIIENKHLPHNEDTLIGILTIIPNEPRRNLDTIIKTYQNIGFSNIKKMWTQETTKEEMKELEMSVDNDDETSSESREMASAEPETIKTIMDTLRFCKEEQPFDPEIDAVMTAAANALEEQPFDPEIDAMMMTAADAMEVDESLSNSIKWGGRKKTRKRMTRKRMTRKRMTRKRMTRKRMTRKRMTRKRMTRKRMTRKRMTRKRMTRKRMTRKRMTRKRMTRKRMTRKKLKKRKINT